MPNDVPALAADLRGDATQVIASQHAQMRPIWRIGCLQTTQQLSD